MTKTRAEDGTRTPWEVEKRAPEVFRAALSEDTYEVGVLKVRDEHWLPHHFGDAFEIIDKEIRGNGWIVLRPREFADLRKFGRSILDFETCARKPQTGAMLWGYEIVARIKEILREGMKNASFA